VAQARQGPVYQAPGHPKRGHQAVQKRQPEGVTGRHKKPPAPLRRGSTKPTNLNPA